MRTDARQPPAMPRRWRHLPPPTIRLRLTAIYGGLFLACGAALLAITYFLVRNRYGGNFFVTARGVTGGASVRVHGQSAAAVAGPPGSLQTSGPVPPGFPSPAQVLAQAHAQSQAALHQLLVQSGIALAITAVIAIGLGWIVAGRVLRPLRTMTATARRISEHNLHERLAVAGPDDELTQLGNTFDQLLGRLESSFEAQRQFVANASHELRTPLTVERTLVEVALADPGASVDSLRHMGERVLANGQHQERLIEALLTLSRSQRGRDDHQAGDLAVTAAVALKSVDRSGLTVETDLRPAWTSGDPALAERLVANLVGNAVVHNLPGGSVSVETATEGGRSVVTVSNTGPVVPAGELDRLFQPFQRLDGDRAASADGVGLGLSIVRAIAEAHRATLDVEPRPGGGLRVTVAFPASPPPANGRSTR